MTYDNNRGNKTFEYYVVNFNHEHILLHTTKLKLILICFFKLLGFNSLSANPTKWSNTLELFECVSPFCGVGA